MATLVLFGLCALAYVLESSSGGRDGSGGWLIVLTILPLFLILPLWIVLGVVSLLLNLLRKKDPANRQLISAKTISHRSAFLLGIAIAGIALVTGVYLFDLLIDFSETVYDLVLGSPTLDSPITPIK